jgi:hypothetical protein
MKRDRDRENGRRVGEKRKLRSIGKNSALSVKKTLLDYKDKVVNILNKIIIIYSDNQTKPRNTLCGQTAGLRRRYI